MLRLIAFFAFLLGHSFRQLNHGDLNYELKEENKNTSWLTFVIGLFIVLLLIGLLKGC